MTKTMTDKEWVALLEELTNLYQQAADTTGLEADLCVAQNELAEATPWRDNTILYLDQQLQSARRQLAEAEEDLVDASEDADLWQSRALYAGKVLLDVLEFEHSWAPNDECAAAFERLPKWVKARLGG